ncbi:hypothetical protein K8R04_04485 [Candidatus Uhrbacteria bacterium]|nr:hypothetical protein [Candidatus Uhrbacteria bacterium]
MKMKTSPNDVSNQEIMQVLNKLTAADNDIKQELNRLNEKMDTKFSSLDQKIDGVHMETMEAIHELSSQTDSRFMLVENRLTRVEARMVTKDYLDDKLADQYSKIIEHTDKRIENALS